jgi:hypothetical protein
LGLLEEYILQQPQGILDDYERQQNDPIAFQDERLQSYLESPFAYNRVLTAEDPIEERQRLENIYHLSQYYNFDMGKVHANYDAISRHYFGEGTIETNNQVIKDAQQAGKLSIEIDELKSDYMDDENPDFRELIQGKIDFLNAQMPPEDALKRNLPVASAKEFMRNVPNWINVAEETTPFKAVYDHYKLMSELKKNDPDNPLLKGTLGSAIVALVNYVAEAKGKPYIPTELAFLGGPAGLVAGAWKVYEDRETASTYYDLDKIRFIDSEGKEVGLDENIKRGIALGFGGLKATAEVWSDVVAFKGIPGIDKIFEKGFAYMASRVSAKATLNNVLTKILSKGLAITGAEIGTEWIQASIDLSANSFADFLEEEKELLQDFKVTKEEVFSTYKEVLIKTALATAPLALLGAGATGIRLSINSPVMENIIRRNIQNLGDNFTAKAAIDGIKEDPEFQRQIGTVPEVTIIDIVARKEALITKDFVSAMERQVAEGVEEGASPITQIDEETGLRRPLDEDTEEFNVARETFKQENIDNYFPARDLSDVELKRIYQETIVDFGLDQDQEGLPGLSFEQFKTQRQEFTSSYINWRTTPEAQRFLATLSPAVDVIQRVIDNAVVEDAGSTLARHSEELGRIVSEAKAGGDVQTILDYNIQKDLQIEAIESEIERLQELGRSTKDQNQINLVNQQIREYIDAKHELTSSRNELSTILELVARELFNETRIQRNLERTAAGLFEHLEFLDSFEYEQFLEGEASIMEAFANITKDRLISQDLPGEGLDIFDSANDEFRMQLEKDFAEMRPILASLVREGRHIETRNAQRELVVGIMQKSLSNYLKLQGERYIKSINVDISKNISLPRAEMIEKIQKAVNLVDGIKEEDIAAAKVYVQKTFYYKDGTPIESIQGENAKTIASTLLNAMEITFDENLDVIGPKLSLSDLIHLKTEVDLLRYLGKVELSEAKKGNLISDEIRKSEFLVYQENVVETSEKKKNIFKGLNFFRLQSYQWGHKIFGDQGRKLFWTDFLTAFNEKVKNLDQRSEAVREAINDDQYEWGEKMYETRVVGDHDFMLQDLLYMYVGRHDPDIRTNILYKTQDIDPNTMSEYIGEVDGTGLIDEELKDFEKTAAETIANDLRAAYNDIRVTYEEATGQRLGFIDAYLPLIRLTLGQKDLEQELAITMLRGTDQSTDPANKNFLLVRDVTTKENATPVRTDLWGIWQDYVQKQEHYINLNDWVRKSRAFIDDSEVSATITENYDKSWTDGIKKYVDDIATPGRLHSSSAFDETVRRYKHNVALANLALKSNIILRQLPSSLLYVEEAGIGNWMGSQLNFLNFKENMYKDSKGKLRHKMVDFINEHDPSTIKSHTEYDFLNYKRPDTKGQKFKRKFDKFGMKGISAADTMVKTIGWTAVYNRYLTDLGHEGAVSKARDWTALTQPSSNKLSLPGMYRHSEMANALFMFTQQPVKLLNHLTGEVVPNVFGKDGNRMAGFYGLLALGMSNSIIWALTNRRVPEDAEDWSAALFLGGISWIPGFGRTMARHLEGKNSYSSSQFQDPAIGVLDIVNPRVYLDSINAAQSGDMAKFNTQFNNIMKGAGVWFGVPSGFIIKAKDALGEEDWWSHLFLGGPLGEKK